MKTCARCENPIEDREVHIFWGGEERRKKLETDIGSKVSLCDFPIDRVDKPILCTCGRYMFDFDIPCPLCGKTYQEAKGGS